MCSFCACMTAASQRAGAPQDAGTTPEAATWSCIFFLTAGLAQPIPIVTTALSIYGGAIRVLRCGQKESPGPQTVQSGHPPQPQRIPVSCVSSGSQRSGSSVCCGWGDSTGERDSVLPCRAHQPRSGVNYDGRGQGWPSCSHREPRGLPGWGWSPNASSGLFMVHPSNSL